MSDVILSGIVCAALFAIAFNLTYKIFYDILLPKISRKYKDEEIISIIKHTPGSMAVSFGILGFLFGCFILPYVFIDNVILNEELRISLAILILAIIAAVKRFSSLYVLFEKHIEVMSIFNVFNPYLGRREINYEDIKFVVCHKLFCIQALEIILKDGSSYLGIAGYGNLKHAANIISEEAQKYKLSYDP